MSLLGRNAGLMVFSALLIFSCKEKEQIGVQPQDNTVGVFYTEDLPITTSAVLKNDSIDTGNKSYAFVGAFKDSVFGNVYAETYTQLILKDENKDLTGSTIDSVVMNLAYNYYYGDTTQAQTINVYKISDDLSTDATYFSNHPDLALSTQIDSNEPFDLRPKKSLNVRVKMDNAFGAEIFNHYNNVSKTNADFLNAFKGIALIPGDQNKGAIVRFKLDDNTSKITIHYKKSLTDDSLSFDLLLNSTGANFSRIIRGTSVALPIDLGGKVYMQSGLGPRTKIKFPTLSQFKDSLGNIAINRAELVLQVDPLTIVPYSPIGSIQLIKLDEDENPRKFIFSGISYDDVVQADLYDINGISAPLEVGYNGTSNTYTFNITTYFNAMVDGREPNNGLVIASSSSINRSSVNRVLANSVKIKVYYTKVE